ncbi:hypothetical protein FDZ71_03835 [bacterium]|nr:MAG: hypothetical protein FDZ71_03835 [bacterium]
MDTDIPVIVVAATFERAAAIARFVERSGREVRTLRDLSEALEQEAKVLVIDPAGWEYTCRAILEDVDRRKAPPPAVFFVGEDDSPLFEAGPALDVLTMYETSRELAEKMRMAIAGRSLFAGAWQRLRGAFRDYDISRLEKIIAERMGVSVRSDRREALRHEFFLRSVANLSVSPQELESYISSHVGGRDIAILTSRVVAGETYFWRYSGQMQALKGVLRRRHEETGGAPLKVWCAGCSTGEEVYSSIMAAFEELGESAKVTVFGTDINSAALLHAREGCYSERSIRNLPERFLERWCKKEIEGYKVLDEVKERAVFEKHNLCGGDSYQWVRERGPFDAVFLRNVVIYLDPESSRKATRLCLGSVVKGGGFFLGSAEMLVPIPEGIDVVHEAGAFFYVKGKAFVRDDDIHSDEGQSESVSNPEDLEALYKSGLADLAEENFSDAEKKFNMILELSPGDTRGDTGIAVLMTNQGREVEASQKLQKVLAEPNPRAEAYFLKGLLDERAGRDNEALSMYGNALNLDRGLFMANVNRAWILKRRGRMGAFKKEMQSALELLKRAPEGLSWTTGGLGNAAIMKMVVDSLSYRKYKE